MANRYFLTRKALEGLTWIDDRGVPGRALCKCGLDLAFGDMEKIEVSPDIIYGFMRDVQTACDVDYLCVGLTGRYDHLIPTQPAKWRQWVDEVAWPIIKREIERRVARS